MAVDTPRSPVKASFNLGDVVEEPVYHESPGRSPVLLLARGQRITTPTQVRRLREAGYRVNEPPAAARPNRTIAARPPAAKSDAVSAQFAQRMDLAGKHRTGVQQAARSMMSRVQSDAPLDLFEAMEISTFLVKQVADDPVGLVALTTLRQCDDYTVDHSADVSILMVAIGYRLGWSAANLRDLAMAGLLHDVGKHQVPAEILDKPGPLTEEELATVRQHPQWGHDYLKQTEGCPERVTQVALQHHERLDGSGYPQGLPGGAIHPAAHIAAVANAFDSLTSDRAFRPGIPAREALRQLFAGRGKLFGEASVDALIKLIGVFPVGTTVLLSTGSRATVIDPNPNNTTKPVVLVTHDHNGQSLPTPRRLVLEDSPATIVEALTSEDE